MSNGWIKLHRSMIDWEWYTDQNTSRLFIHCLIRANHSDTKWRGNIIKRGQFITSLDTLSCETGLTISQIRTAFKKLVDTDEIASLSQARSRIITVVKYDQYQADDKLIASSSQADDKLMTTDKNVKNDNNEKKKESWTHPEGLNLEAWTLFVNHRKEIKKPLKTDNMKKGQANKLKDLTPDQQMAVVKQSLDEGWTGLFPEKIATPQSKPFNQPQQEGAKFRPYVHEKTERTQPPPGMFDEWSKKL